MTIQKLVLIGLGLCIILNMGCGGSDKKADATSEQAAGGAQEESQSVEEAMKDVKEALQGNGEVKEVVDFRKLKELLPEELAGMDRISHSGEKAGMFGMNMSTATAEYRGDDQELEVTFVDFAGMSAALSGLAGWATMEMDRETDSGYERTTMIDGYKAFEKYDKSSKSVEVSLLVENRFIVTVNGRNIEEKTMAKAIDQLGLKQLARLK